jgi:hypothetical protein
LFLPLSIYGWGEILPDWRRMGNQGQISLFGLSIVNMGKAFDIL